MRAMKDSGIEWIGEIPESWSLCRIKRVAEIITGNTPSKASDNLNYSEDGIMWIKPDNLMGTIPIQETIEHLSEEGTKLARVVPSKTPLICCIGTVGKVGYAEEEASFNQQINAICFDNTIGTRFGLYCLIAQEEQQKCFANGNVLKILNAETQGNLFIAIPPLDEQMNISKYLDTKCAEIDALIAAKEKTNTLGEERRQSIIYEAVTKGLDPTVPMKDSGVEWIGEIPEGWEIAALKRLGIPATGSTPSKDSADYWDGDIPWVSSKDMKSDYILDSEDHITQAAVDECGLTLFPPGTLIFCVRSGILRHTFPVAVATLPVTINQDLRALSLTGDVNPAFLLYYMRGMNDTVVTLYQKIGATVESIEMDWFLYFPVVLPAREEQDRIVEALDSRCASLDQTVKQNEATIRQLKEYRQSVIYEAVTGKIEV